MRRILLALILIATPAFAAEKVETPKGDAKGKAEAKDSASGKNVDMPYLMAPLTGPDGKLSGYAYIVSRLTAASSGAALTVRDKLAFIQDAFVRDVNGVSVAAANDPNTVDIAKVEARLMADAKKIVGAANVRTVTVCTVQVAALHVKEAPPLADSKDLVDQKAIPQSRCASDSGA